MSMSTQKSALRLAVIAVAAIAANSFAELPAIRITTQNNATPTSSANGGCASAGCDWNTNPWGCMGGGGMNMGLGPWTFPYVAVTNVQITDPGAPMNNINRNTTKDSIRIRGNSTSQMDKRPYRIKFGDRIALFGREPAKSWVLLANYYDGTFALNAVAFELGKRLGLEFTPTSKLVDLYINNQYKGIYQVTEQIQSHKGRVDLKENKRGWLVEVDYHAPASDECSVRFTAGTNACSLGTFIKSPELDDTAFTKNPNDASQLNFVKNDVNNLINKMLAGGFPTNGYRDLIDLESFAKYVLIQLVMDNFDFNSKAQDGFLPGSNYMYRVDSSKTTKIKAGPLWDFDLAAGVERTPPITGGGNIFGGGFGQPSTFPAHYRTTQDSIVPTHPFYKKLWEDPVFKAKYMKLWNKHKSDFQAMPNFIDEISREARGSVQGKGTNLWANNSTAGSSALTENQFNTEVQNLKNWWNSRVNFVDQRLRGMNIDTTKDIIDPPVQTPPKDPTSAGSAVFGKAGSGLAVVKNGLAIRSSGAASVKVVSLTGNVVRKRVFAAGSHAVRLGDLPRGMYLVRVNLDGVKKTVRVAVK